MSCNCSCDCCDESRFLELFHFIAPELNEPDDRILMMKRLCEPLVSKCQFGELYEQALVNLVAHKLVIRKAVEESADGSMSSKLVAGSVISEKEGDLARSYGFTGSGSDKGSGDMDLLEKTAYGLEYRRIRDMCVLAVATRFGSGCC